MTVKLIGIGNAWRGDDAAGAAVARALQAERLPGLAVLEASGEGVALMEAWQGADAVVLVDAVQSGAPPGTVHRFDATTEPLPTSFFHYSTHAFSVAEAVEVARALGALPPRVLVVGIEGRRFEAGAPLSPEVQAAIEEVIAQLPALLRPWLDEPAPTASESVTCDSEQRLKGAIEGSSWHRSGALPTPGADPSTRPAHSG